MERSGDTEVARLKEGLRKLLPQMAGILDLLEQLQQARDLANQLVIPKWVTDSELLRDLARRFRCDNPYLAERLEQIAVQVRTVKERLDARADA